MAFNITEFRSQLAQDGYRPNLFSVTMNFPAVAASATGSQKLTFMCHAASLPGSFVGVAPAFYFGRQAKFAGNRVFNDWQITVYMDEDYSIRDSFERWSNVLNSHVGNIRAQGALAPSSYVTDAVVQAYGKTGNIVKTYKLTAIFPTNIGEVGLDWANMNTIGEFTVELATNYWTASTTDS